MAHATLAVAITTKLRARLRAEVWGGLIVLAFMYAIRTGGRGQRGCNPRAKHQASLKPEKGEGAVLMLTDAFPERRGGCAYADGRFPGKACVRA